MHNEFDILPSVSLLKYYSKKYLNDKLHKKYGIGENHMELFIYLLHHDGVNQESIAENFCKDKSSIARSLKKLEGMGYIDRVRNPHDHRNLEVRLTPKAKKIAPELKEIIQDWLKIIYGDIPKEKLRFASELLKKITENAKKEIKE